MKKIALVMISTLACVTPCQADEASNVATAEAMIEAINSRDLDRLDALVAPNVVRHSAATTGVTIRSLDDFKAFLRSDFAAIPDSVIEIDVIFGNDDFVAMRAIYAGTQTGQMGPFPPTGKHAELPFLGILRFADGMIAEIWVEWDNIHILTQLGHLSPPADH